MSHTPDARHRYSRHSLQAPALWHRPGLVLLLPHWSHSVCLYLFFFRWQSGFKTSSQQHGSLSRIILRSPVVHNLCQRPQPARAGRSCDPVRWRYPGPHIRCQTPPSQPHPTHGVYPDLFSIVVPCTRTKTQHIQNGNPSPRHPPEHPRPLTRQRAGRWRDNKGEPLRW